MTLVLIDNGLLYSAGLIMTGGKPKGNLSHPSTAAGGIGATLLDLSTLLDAVAHYDHVVVLAAQEQDEVLESVKRALRELHILRELSRIPFAAEIKRDILNFLSSDLHADYLDREQLFAEWMRFCAADGVFVSQLVHNRLQVPENPYLHPSLRIPPSLRCVGWLRHQLTQIMSGRSSDDRRQDGLSHATREIDSLIREPAAVPSDAGESAGRVLNDIKSFNESGVPATKDDILGALIADFRLISSGNIGTAFAGIRTLLYWQVSDRLRVPLLPCLSRRGQLERIAWMPRREVQMQIATTVARAFAATVEEVREDDQDVVLTMPPPLTIFAEEFKRSRSLRDAIRAVHDAYSTSRAALREYARRSREATTLSERVRSRRRLQAVLGELAAHYRYGENSRLAQGIGYAPELLRPLLGPRDSSQFGVGLLSKPADRIREWWRRRPFRHIFNLRSRLELIESHDELLRSALRVELSKGEIANFKHYLEAYIATYAFDSEEPASARHGSPSPDGITSKETSVSIAVLTIRQDEYDAVRAHMPNCRLASCRSITYLTSDVPTCGGGIATVALAKLVGAQGDVESQKISNQLIDELNPQWIIMSGIGGAVPDDAFSLFDVIVSNGVFDLTVQEARPDGERRFAITGGNNLHQTARNAVQHLSYFLERVPDWHEPIGGRPVINLEDVEKRFGQTGDAFKNWNKRIRDSLEHNFRSQRPPKVVAAAVASASTLMKDAEIVDHWLDVAKQIAAIDMEAAGLFAAARGRVPALVIRGISDLVGLRRAEDHNSYAAAAAGAVTIALIRAGFFAADDKFQ